MLINFSHFIRKNLYICKLGRCPLTLLGTNIREKEDRKIAVLQALIVSFTWTKAQDKMDVNSRPYFKCSFPRTH
jgi:hypothetical protein